MRRLTPFAWILLLLAVVGLTVGVCVTASCSTGTKQPAPDGHPSNLPGGGWQMSNAPPYPAPTKTMQREPAVEAKAFRFEEAPVPYQVVSQDSALDKTGTRHFFVVARAGTGETFRVEVVEQLWAKIAFEKRICASGGKWVGCP